MRKTMEKPRTGAKYAASRAPGRHQGGFSLMEMSMVLVVIGVILGAVSIGKSVHRSAVYQRATSEFIQGWLLAYDNFVIGQGVVPGDSIGSPTGCVAGTCATNMPPPAMQVCDNSVPTLRALMIQAGIGLPQGRAEGREDRYAYLDSNGLPHDLQVCFQNVQWAEPTATPGTYTPLPRNVMVVTGATPALAGFIDHYLDTVIDARAGTVREAERASYTALAGDGLWSRDETAPFNGNNTAAPSDESQVAEVTLYIKMAR